MPKVSIIIPTFNSAHYVLDALKSVLAQSYQDFEVLIIDDGSSDNTKELLQPFVAADPDRIFYFYQDNQGLACARNTALAKARGEFIALLDADDIYLPERLAKTVAVLEDDADVCLAHANIIKMAENGDALGVVERQKSFLSGDIFENIFLRKAHMACPTVLFRKSCYEEFGGFDPQLARLGCEDRELWLRFAQKYKMQYVDEPLAHYRVSATSMSKNKEKMMEARLYVVNKFAPLDCKEKRFLRNAALAKIYRDVGDEFLFAHDFAQAKNYYSKAMKHHPFSFWLWVNFVKALLKVEVKYVC